MTASWTPQKVIDLAPDSSSAGAGQALGKASKWKLLGRSGRALWGEVLGSGKDPYRVRVDLSGPVFKCSCPSRKFPCKHGLGLMLIFASAAGDVPEKAEPEWVSDWLKDREQAAATKAAKAQDRTARPPADAEAQAKRQANREAKILAGLEELSTWLEDLVRQGLAAAQAWPVSQWESAGARLVDAQAPGLARWIRKLGETASSGEGWQTRLMADIGRVHLLVEAYRRSSSLPEGTRAEVRSLVGWTQDQDELLRQEGVTDRWVALAQMSETEDRLRVQRTWLWGVKSRRPALVLHFDAGPAARKTELVAASAFDGELVFYPGSTPLRALVKSRATADLNAEAILGLPTVAQAMTAYARALAGNLWIERWPMALAGVTIQREPDDSSERWIARDGEGGSLPLSRQAGMEWQWLSISGGRPMGIFAEWDGQALTPLAGWTGGRIFCVSRGQERTRIIRAG